MLDQGRDLLVEGGSLDVFGRLLHESWLAKRSLDAAVSTSEIDQLYQRGIEAGAWGGKLLGAGGGGFIAFIAPPESHDRLRVAFMDKFVLKVKIEAPGSQIIF